MDLPQDIAGYQQLVEKLLVIIDEQRATITMLEGKVAALEGKVVELEARLKQNSRNSHRPPSSDGYRKPAALPKEPKSRGGQLGHKGDTLKMVAEEEVTHRMSLYATQCECGKELKQADQVLQSKRQVFDLPEPKLEVTQYEQYGCTCEACGRNVSAAYPAEVKAPTQYGARIKATLAVLNVSYSLSLEKVEQLMGDLFGRKINQTTVQHAVAEAYDALEATEVAICKALEQEQVAHLDETSIRVSGKCHWLHVCSSARYTHLMVHAKRGKEAILSANSLAIKLVNWLVHDCWPTYFLLTNAKHAICLAHMLRELQALMEQNSPWAGRMHSFLLKMYQKSDAGKGIYTQRFRAAREYNSILHDALQFEPPPSINKRGKPTKTKGRNLAERMQTRKDEVLAFIQYSEVPFTNNQAERDIRPVKTKMKVSGCFRTLTGAEYYARIRGFASTARKQELNPLSLLTQAMRNPQVAVAW